MATYKPGGYVMLNQRSVTLTDAQIKALPTTSVVVIPAIGDGSNRILVPFLSGIVFAFDWTANYENATVDSEFKLTIGSWDTTLSWYVKPTIGLDNFWTYGKSVLWQVCEPQVTTQGTEGEFRQEFSSPLSLEISGNSGDLTGGHASNTLTVAVLYSVYDVSTKRFV